MTATTSSSSEKIDQRDTLTQPAGLRRSCLVCRVIGLALVIGSVMLLLMSSAQMMDIGLFAAFALYWLVGAGATLVILSVSALRQSNNAS